MLQWLCALAMVSGAQGDGMPKLGFVTVPGDARSDDWGADPRVLGLVQRHSAATVFRVTPEELAHLDVQDRWVVGFLTASSSAEEVRRYNARGVYDFIFENEPDGTALADPDWARHSMERHRIGHALVKSVNPRNRLIAGNLFTFSHDPMLRHGFAEVAEVVGFHNYSNDPANGIAIGAVGRVREELAAGGLDLPIFLGEGWGPMREVPGIRRTNPHEPPSIDELEALRAFVVNGHRTLTRKTGAYDPAWVTGALFFTLNDNWGGRRWAQRARPVTLANGEVAYYLIDGYNVGQNVAPKFYNGGLTDLWGNSKDDLMDLFPGDRMSLANMSFAIREGQRVYGWKVEGRVAAPRGGGIEIESDGRFEVSQRTGVGGLDLARGVTFVARTAHAPTVRVRAVLEALDGEKVVARSESEPQPDGVERATLARVPDGADGLRVRIVGHGRGGAAIHAARLYAGTGVMPAARVEGYVLDAHRQPVAGAEIVLFGWWRNPVLTDDRGWFSAEVQPGQQGALVRKRGFADHAVRFTVAPGGVRALGFELVEQQRSTPTALRAVPQGDSVELRWQAPRLQPDRYRVYRSLDAQAKGDVVGEGRDLRFTDGAAPTNVVCTYRVAAIYGRQERLSEPTYATRTSGRVVTVYQVGTDATWGHFGRVYEQEFVSPEGGDVAGATAIVGLPAGGPPGVMLEFSVRRGSPDGPQVGPSRRRAGGRDVECQVAWSQGEVPLAPGVRYWLRVEGDEEFAAYRAGGSARGGLWIDGEPAPGTSLWSTIRVALPGRV